MLIEGVIICDHEYPVRPAFSLLTKLLDDFTAKIPQSSFGNPSAINFPEVTTYLEKYQDPRKADAIMKVQQELDETKIVLVSFWPSCRMTVRVVNGTRLAQNDRVGAATWREDQRFSG